MVFLAEMSVCPTVARFVVRRNDDDGGGNDDELP
jgi:hypothetical protein